MTPLRSGSRRNILILAAAGLVFLQADCRSVQRLPGQWLDLPAQRQGPLADFSRKLTSHMYENGMMIGLGNDERNLYVFFSPDVHSGQRLPGRARFTLWIDAKGGRTRRLGLEHISGPPESHKGTPAQAPGQSHKGTPAQAPGLAQELLKIIDRTHGKETYVAMDGSHGPTVRLASDWGDFTYQLRIPLQGSGSWPGLDIVPGQSMGIGCLWEIEHPHPAATGSMDGPRGGPGDRGGMPPGMEGGPGNMPGTAAASKRKIWVKTILAKP